MPTVTNRNSTVNRAIAAAIGISAALMTTSAHAAFHLWTIKELFTNIDGTQQFIELSTTSSGQNFLGGRSVQVTDQAGTTTHMYMIPSDIGGGTADTANHTFLIATSNITAANGVTPDYATLPAGFLFGGGGKISLVSASQGQVPYTTLPNDGVHAESFPGPAVIVNRATNFAGASAQVVPEPATWGLLGLGGIGCCFLLRRIGPRPERR